MSSYNLRLIYALENVRTFPSLGNKIFLKNQSSSKELLVEKTQMKAFSMHMDYFPKSSLNPPPPPSSTCLPPVNGIELWYCIVSSIKSYRVVELYIIKRPFINDICCIEI